MRRNTIFFWELKDGTHYLYCGLCQQGDKGSIAGTDLTKMDYHQILERVAVLIDNHIATEEHWTNEEKQKKQQQ